MMQKTSVFWLITVVTLGLLSVGCQDKINFLKARNELNRGVSAFSRSDYSFAVEHFQKAIEYDPELLAARQYLATAYMMQFIPGSKSEENMKIAQQALEGFREVLERDPDNANAVSYIASLYFNMEDMENAKEWYGKLLEYDPDNKEAHYTMGVIAWTEAYQPRLETRSEYFMKQEDPGPLLRWCNTNRRLSGSDRRECREAHAELVERNLPKIEEGMEHLQKAIELDPDYADAMAYLNLLYRERADLAETKEEHDEYIAKADEWVEKTLATKKRLAEEGTKELFQEGQ